jgi:two-component system, sensor histidine kinase and response regulator
MFINSEFTALVTFPGDQTPLVGMFRWDLVALSVVIAVCGAWAGLSCLTRAESVSANSPAGSALWKIAGGIGFGGSIWGMHFIGMLAFSLPCGISYDFLLTSLSIVPGILASLTAMTVVGRADFSLYTRLAVGSVLMGAGIGAMHYTGMAAMRMPAILMYDPFYAALSVVAAVGLSFVALSVVEHGQRHSTYFFLRKLIAAAILGSAVASMHYVAMQAAIFFPTLDVPAQEGQLSQGVMALLVSLATLALAGAVVAASFAARLKEQARVLAEEVQFRTAAEKTARAGQMRLQAILDTAVEAIIVIDRKGLIQQWSDSAERIFGYPAEEILGRNIAIIMDGISPMQHDDYLQRYHDTGQASIIGIGREVVGRRRDGSTVPIDLSVGETVVDGEILYTGILRDITKRKEIERELLEATRAKQANELKTNFLAHMSHEMRTPLNAILGFSDIMKMQTFGPLDKTYREYASDIFASGNHLLNLVDALLDLSRIESNTQDLEIADLDVRSMLKDVESMLHDQAKEKNLTVATLIDNDLPQTIESDRGKLQQILINLVNNAVRYTPDNGRISVRAWPSTDSVKILVEDDGIGMTDDEIALALKPFGQVKNAFTSDVAGTGLGLPIVVSFLDLLRGDMRIESEKGKGTSVCIRIPMRFAERPHRRGSIAH